MGAARVGDQRWHRLAKITGKLSLETHPLFYLLSRHVTGVLRHTQETRKNKHKNYTTYTTEKFLRDHQAQEVESGSRRRTTAREEK